MTAIDHRLPGADLVERGLADLERGSHTVEAMLVAIGAPRLRDLGFPVRSSVTNPEHRLYELLVQRHGSDEAHSRYNALVRRLVSFEQAAACVA